MGAATGLLIIIVLIAFGAYFIQSGQSGVLQFGKFNFGVPLGSIAKDPIIKYQDPNGRTTSRTPTRTGTGTGTNVGTVTRSPVSTGGQGVGTAFTTPLPPMPAGSPTTRFSSNYGRVRLGTIRPGSATSVGQVTLKANFTGGNAVNVTGWYLKANHGGWYVPQAVKFYHPSGLSQPQDIILGRGETLNMFTNVSPLGVNMRLNICMGYLANTNKFVPTISKQCPGADRTVLKNFSSQCQDYVPNAVASCKVPASNPPLPYFDDGCRDYLKQFNYGGCYNTYYGDQKFLSSEWRVWMGSTFLDPRHDRLFLLDQEGFLVDYKDY